MKQLTDAAFATENETPTTKDMTMKSTKTILRSALLAATISIASPVAQADTYGYPAPVAEALESRDSFVDAADWASIVAPGTPIEDLRDALREYMEALQVVVMSGAHIDDLMIALDELREATYEVADAVEAQEEPSDPKPSGSKSPREQADDLIEALNDFIDATEVLFDWVTPGPKPDWNNNGK